MAIIAKLLSFLRSPKFFVWIVALFLVQGTMFALIVDPSNPDSFGSCSSRDAGVVPDGNRHIAAIYLFAEQPLSEGPFVENDSCSLWIGDLERFPSYLYYYVMSFFVRVSMALGASDMMNVMVIRFASLALGLLALFVFRKIVRELKVGELTVNLASLGLVLTGSFAWLAPAENYDIMALLTFFLFMLASLRLVSRHDPRQLYFMALWFFVGGVTKYTYIPFMGAIGLAAVIMFIRRAQGVKKAFRESVKDIAAFVRARRLLSTGLLLLLVVAGFLFSERIIGNLVQYQSFNPDCAAIHSHDECMLFGVYSRNYNRAQAVAAGEFDDFSYHPGYTLYWIDRYYTSMYTYLAHIPFEPNRALMYPGFVVIVGASVYALVYARRRKERIIISPQLWLVAGAVGLMVVSQYIFNTLTYVNTHGATYAHQGRYLLPVIGFVYVFMIIAVGKALRLMMPSRRRTATLIFLILGALAVIIHSATVMFFVHADTLRWYNVELLPFLANLV